MSRSVLVWHTSDERIMREIQPIRARLMDSMDRPFTAVGETMAGIAGGLMIGVLLIAAIIV